MFTSIKAFCDALKDEFDKIPSPRKEFLNRISGYIISKKTEKKPVNLVYICTHNSRRSQFGQIWAKVASIYYKVPNVYIYSGGTEATAFSSNAINALIRTGFKIKPVDFNKNSVYSVSYDEKESPILCFSKVYNDPKNPQKDFAAIMTCGEAEENCPFIPGAELRIAATYNDPKAFDNTTLQDSKYDECCRQIALETFYVFSKSEKQIKLSKNNG